MAEEKKDFKEVKVKITGGHKEHTDTLSRSMLYSGVNIFGQLSQLYQQSKDEFQSIALMHSGGGGAAGSGANTAMAGNEGGSGTTGMMSLNSEVLQIFKRLQKRDAITKVKAFQELEAYLNGVEQGSDELSNLLTFFLYHMCRILMNERDKKVRESAHQAFAAFIRKGKRKLGPHLKKIFPLWLCSFFDPSPEVARLAQANFDSAFPEAKQGAVFKLVFKNFLHFADEQLRQSEEASAHLEGLSQEAAHESFDRITSSVLLALAHSFRFIEDWSLEEQEQFKSKLLDVLDLNNINATEEAPEEQEEEKAEEESKEVAAETTAEAQPAAKKRGRGRRGTGGGGSQAIAAKKQKAAATQQAQNYMWAFLSQNYRGRVRAACLQFVSVFINKMPENVVSSQLSQFAPLVFNLVGDQNSLLQTSLWRDAIFNIGRKFSHSWTYISIKKDFLPKLNKCLKEAAYGAPVVLYENFVKYVSICPVYQLTGVAQPNEGKLNKVSFKERCNLLRELMQALFAGLKNDESVAFHVELVSSYYETLTFLLLKRVQPMMADESLKPTEKEFALAEISKVIKLPLTEFVTEYAKFKTAVQNARNIRVTIPKRFAKMLIDLAQREVNQELFTLVCQQFYDCLDHTERNSGRLFACLLKASNQISAPYRQIVSKIALGPMIASLCQELTKEIPDANKQTVEGVVKKCALLRRIFYTLNKNASNSRDLVADFALTKDLTLPSGELLLKVQITEKMAQKVLTKDNLDNFMLIKTCLVESTILMMNLGWVEPEEEMLKILTQGIFVDKLANPVLQKGTDKLEEMVYLPETAIPDKVKFELYFDAVRENEDIHAAMTDTMSDKMLRKDEIVLYKTLIATCIDRQTRDQPSPLTEEDVDILKSFVILVLQDDVESIPLKPLAAYFTASKDLLAQQGDEQNEEMRVLLLELLLLHKVERYADRVLYDEMWTVFKGALSGKPNYVQHCVDKLGSAVADLINSDSNNLQGVANFQHLTTLIHKFAHLQEDKVDVLKRIVLTPANFANLETNPLPLKMFRDLFLDGSINFDISVLMAERGSDGSYSYAWLLASMLNFKYLVSLTNFLELKNQLIIFVESDVIPGIIVGDRPMIVNLCETVANEALAGDTTNSYQLTLEYFVQKLVDPGEEFPADMKPVLKIDEFQDILDKVGKQTALKLIETNFGGDDHSIRAIDILVRLLSQISYFILDEPVIKNLFNLTKSNLSAALEAKSDLATLALCPYQIRLYMALAKYFEPAQKAEQTALFQIDLVNYLLESQESATPAFKSTLQQAAIEITGNILAEAPKDAVKEKLDTVEVTNNIIEMLMQISEQVDNPAEATQIDCRTLIQLCSVLKKTFGWTPELSGTLVSIFIQAVRDRAAWFDKRVQEQAKSMAGGLQQLEVEMLKEMGETLLVCVSYISEDALKANIENNLYYIIGCRVEGLQKAAFVLLKYIYENFIPPVVVASTEEDELRQLREDFLEESKGDEEEESKEDRSRGKAAIAFQNVSRNLIELIDNAPNVISQDTDGVETQFMQSNEVLERLVLGENQDGCMNSKIYGYFLAWNAMLIKIEQGRIKSQLTQAKQYQSVLASLTDYLEANSPIYEMLLVSLVPFFPIVKKSIAEDYGRDLLDYQPEYCCLTAEKECRVMCLHTLINFMKSFPSLARKFYDSCDKQILNVTKPYIKKIVSPAIMENEIKKIEFAQLELGDSQLTFVLYKSTKEIVATYDKNMEVSVQIKLKIPTEYPLKSVVVDLTDQLKLKAGMMRKWSLSIRNLIQSRNGDIISAILLWKSNIDNEMDGVEECHICYCVLHGTDRSLPTLPCKNCMNKFHVGCIRKWFNTSNKSNCPLCQTFFWQ